MNISHESATPEEHRRSPKGVYETHRRHVSLALGGRKDTGSWAEGIHSTWNSRASRPARSAIHCTRTPPQLINNSGEE